jgi:uncharacterized protein YggE
MGNGATGVSVLTLVLVGFGPVPARAQGAPPGTITGHGITELKRQPESLRVQVDVLARGKDLKEALAKLRDRRAASRKSLEGLGAAASAIEFGEPAIVPENRDRNRHMGMIMRRMANPGNKPPQKPKEAPRIVVSCTLKANFQLRAADPEELLLVSHALEEGMKAADLGGTKDLKQASAQDEEAAQESAEEMMDFGHSNQPKQGEPVFLYVSKISDEDLEKALAQAFKKAKREAGQLAKAAGVELGVLYHLEDNSSGVSDPEEGIVFDNPYSYRFMHQLVNRARAGSAEEDKPAVEAVGVKPGKVAYRVAVSASFALQKPAAK